MADPWLSVVVPVFNGEAFLADALGSVCKAQALSRRSIEVVVVDDRSTDRSMEIARGFAGDLTINFRARTGERGWIGATNEGLASARGQFTCFLHQDDRWLPNRLGVVGDVLDAHPGLDLVLTASTIIGPGGERLGRWRCPLPAATPLDARMLRDRLVVQNFVAIPAPVFRTGAAPVGAGLDAQLWYTADWDFWLRFAAERQKALYLDKPTVEFRVHADSQTIHGSFDARGFRGQFDTVLARYLDDATPSATARAARLSKEVNITFAGRLHGQPVSWLRLASLALRVRPRALWVFLRDSRILERVLPRLRLYFRGRL